MTYPDKIILAGFMGTGKSVVAAQLAKKLSYQLVDTDELVVRLSGKSIPELFARGGEKRFREWERKAIDRAVRQGRVVISLGGGTICSRQNLRKLRKAGPVILLRAQVETILKRLKGDYSRPLLQTESPRESIQSLLKQRAQYYQQVSWQLDTDQRTPLQIARLILQQLPTITNALQVPLAERSYPLYFQKSGREQFPAFLQQHCPAEQAVLITNTSLDRPYGRAWAKTLGKFLPVKKIVLPDGEKYKNLNTIRDIYQKLVEFKVDRRTPLIALGGGVIGDMVGYAAASFLRGIPFVQVPTTLLAQVDSSIGGKTGVDLPEGKNLVGAFYQPKFVWIDEDFLQTLSPRQLDCGMAEVIKYAAIFDAGLFKQLETEMETYQKNSGVGMAAVIRRCCEWKAWVVERDEHETKGIRAKLNFGHTFGHAIESITRYRRYTHGEAISMGMMLAARQSRSRTGLNEHSIDRLGALLSQAGLPTEMPQFSKKQYLQALTQDKKRVSRAINFVYLRAIGKSVVQNTPIEEFRSWL